jgi:hypothetical protein
VIYQPKFFIVQELVSPEVYQQRGERAWELLDTYLLVTLDQLREEFGPIIVNNWHAGGTFKYSGLRPLTGGVGAEFSQHRFGRGSDDKPQAVTPQEMHARILAKPEKFPYLRVLEAIEATPTWVHTDVRHHNRPGIWVVNP